MSPSTTVAVPSAAVSLAPPKSSKPVVAPSASLVSQRSSLASQKASLAADVVGDVWKADWYVAHCYKIPAMAQLNLVLSQVAQAPTRSDISLPSSGTADLKRFHRDLAELISSAEFAGKQMSVFLHAVQSTASGLQKDIAKRLANENPSVLRNSRRWFPRFPSGGVDESTVAAALATSGGVASAVSGAAASGRESADVRGHDDGKGGVLASQTDRTVVVPGDSTAQTAGHSDSSEAIRNLRLWAESNRECFSATFASAHPPSSDRQTLAKSPSKRTFAARLRSRSMSGVTAAAALFRSPENAVARSKDSASARGAGGAAEAGETMEPAEGVGARNEVRSSSPFSFRVSPPSPLLVGEAEAEAEGDERGGGECGVIANRGQAAAAPRGKRERGKRVKTGGSGRLGSETTGKGKARKGERGERWQGELREAEVRRRRGESMGEQGRRVQGEI
ncbi:hypothetical protein CLOM_g7908 [Closterium sp. NIES-68]|nr:hypothetical protein CLOM_g7908 [Closterium sp. NIES-68]GJP58244.1 hypothetical protein CLOP_g22710 [Closterium sp. NIES-67]